MSRSFLEDPRGGGDVHVLLVDDERTFAEATAGYLQDHHDDFEVEVVTSGEDALAVWEESAIDCIVSDYRMPRMDGLDLLEEVRSENEGVPFVMYTRYGDESIASQAISAGVDDYLRKDGGTDQYTLLANSIRTHVEKHRTEKRHRRLRDRYEAIARCTADALWDWVIDDEMVAPEDVVIRNQGWVRTFGYDPETVEEQLGWWADRIHPDERDRVLAEVDRVVNRGETFYEDEYRFQRADGSYTEVLSRAYVIYDENDDPIHMVGSIIDT